jgi:hypothetical protein
VVDRREAVRGVTPEGFAREFLEWSRNDSRNWRVTFRAWCDSVQLDSRLGREVRVEVERLRKARP